MNDINKAGKMIDFDRENAPEPTQYEIPKVNKTELFVKKLRLDYYFYLRLKSRIRSM